MLTLNLVSEELRKKIKLRHVYGLLKKMGMILVIVVIAIVIILLVAKLILQNNFNKIVEQTTLVTGSSKGYTEMAKTVNSRIKSARQIQDNYIVWSHFFEKISEITPDGITLSFLKVSKEESKMTIRGRALTRDNLLSLKTGLEKSGIFYNIDFPIKNILEKENIDFELNMKINFLAEEWLTLETK